MKPSGRIVTTVVLACLTIASGFASSQEGVLRYRWNKGESLRYRVVQTTNAQMSGLPGMGEMNITNTMTQLLQQTATDVAADGTGTLQMKFEAIKMEMATPMGTFVYDSAAPANTADPMIAQIAATMGVLVGESITVVMSPNGAIQKIQGMSAIAQKVQKTMPGGGLGMPGLDSILSDDAMKGTFGQGFAAFPSTPVKVGETWKQDLTLPNPFGVMNVSSSFTFKDVVTAGGRSLIRVLQTATIKATSGAKPPPLPMPMTIQFSDGTGQGEVLFDPKLGRNQKTTFETTLPMTMSMTAPDGTPVNMSALTKTTMVMELVEK